MSELPWFAWIVIAAIAAGAVGLVMEGIHRIVKERGHQARDVASAGNAEVLARLDGLDRRLARIERTLDEIPS